MYKFLVIWLGKFLLWLMRRRGSGGSALPGLVVEKLYPDFIKHFARRLKGGSIVVTGTNGKTTTTKMIRGILEAEGHRLVSNRAGSNLSRGIASALLEHTNWLGKLDVDIGLFEVDEAFTADVSKKLRPRCIVVLNLLRDQLDRYGELDRTASLIGAGLKYAKTAILNADDPLVAALGKGLKKSKVVWFGASEKLSRLVPHDEALYNKNPVTRNKIQKGKPDLWLRAVELKPNAQHLTIEDRGEFYSGYIKILGIYNAYNALAALVVGTTFGISMDNALKSLSQVEPAYGRTELITVGDKKVQLLLVKNPAGFNQIIKAFLLKEKSSRLLIAVNDNIADGRDVSWLWDVDFEAMAAQKHQILASGVRGYDLALRLKYAQMKSNVELNLARSLSRFIDSLRPGSTGYIVPTYTAMLSLRKMLARQAKVKKVYQ